MDKIVLNQMSFYGYHGLFAEERHLGQKFIVDLELGLSLKKAGQTDDMNDSIHYGQAFELVRDIVEGQAKHLIEALAEDISESLFREFPLLQTCLVRVIKPNAPIPGLFRDVEIAIIRERE